MNKILIYLIAISLSLNFYFIINKVILMRSEALTDEIENAQLSTEIIRLKTNTHRENFCIYFFTSEYPMNFVNSDLKYIYSLSKKNSNFLFIVVDVFEHTKEQKILNITDNLIYYYNKSLYNSIRNENKLNYEPYPAFVIIENNSVIKAHFKGNVSKNKIFHDFF